MQQNKLRLGLVGAGRMGITHYSILNAHPDVSITAVAETTPVVNTMLEKYLGVRTYKSSAKLLEREELDAILVCTPPSLNYAILSQAHRMGVHAFVEKPGTLGPAEALELAEAFDSKGLVNQVGYVNRFNDVFIKSKSLVDRGLIGKVIRYRSEMFSRTIIHEETRTSWRSTRDNGGGAVYEMASHSIDLANYLFGRPDAVAGTCMSRVYSRQVEDVVSSSFLYNSGLVGTLYVNWSDESFRKPTNKIEIFGKSGKMLADQHGLKIYLSAPDEVDGFRAGWNSLSITDLFSSVPFFVRGIEFTAQLFHFVDCIREGRAVECRCTFRDAAAVLTVIEQMFHDQSAIPRVVNR